MLSCCTHKDMSLHTGVCATWTISVTCKFVTATPQPPQAEDLEDFTKRQREYPEEWENLKDEICAIATGAGVTRIEGDQVACLRLPPPPSSLCPSPSASWGGVLLPLLSVFDGG